MTSSIFVHSQEPTTRHGRVDRFRNEFPVHIRVPYRFTAWLPVGTTMGHALRENVFRSKAGAVVPDYLPRFTAPPRTAYPYSRQLCGSACMARQPGCLPQSSLTRCIVNDIDNLHVSCVILDLCVCHTIGGSLNFFRQAPVTPDFVTPVDVADIKLSKPTKAPKAPARSALTPAVHQRHGLLYLSGDVLCVRRVCVTFSPI